MLEYEQIRAPESLFTRRVGVESVMIAGGAFHLELRMVDFFHVIPGFVCLLVSIEWPEIEEEFQL